MRETLEVRLKQSTYPMVIGSADWPYKPDHMRMHNQGDVEDLDQSIEINSEDDTTQPQCSFANSASSMVILTQPTNNYATTSQASQHKNQSQYSDTI